MSITIDLPPAGKGDTATVSLSELDVVKRLGKLLTKEEQDALGKAMEEIELAKVAG